MQIVFVYYCIGNRIDCDAAAYSGQSLTTRGAFMDYWALKNILQLQVIYPAQWAQNADFRKFYDLLKKCK